jgi:hypothetical protein
MGYSVAPLNPASNRAAAENVMPDLDTGVVDLCRHTPRKWKSKMQPFRHTTSMPPNTALRRTQDKWQTIERSHSYEFNLNCTYPQVSLRELCTGLWLRLV